MKHSLSGTARKLLFLLAGLLCAIGVQAQSITVSGTVIDPEGEPLIGATVLAQGTSTGAATDLDGNFTINVAPDATLLISYVGYDPLTVPVDGRTNLGELHMQAGAVMLNEVVAIGYGTVKKSDATGSVSVIKPSEVAAGLASTAQDLLVGASPGLVVASNGGDPSGGSSIQIRGGASLSASNDPLVVIDGVPMVGKSVTGSSNPLGLIAPENIESMTVLKDASATAIYGSRASNGVIIITTKRGQSGAPQVSFAANFYLNTPRKYLDMMDGPTFRNFVADRYGTDSEQYGATQDYNTNWQKEILRTSLSQEYNLSVGGTVGVLPYRVAIGYTDNEGVIRKTNMKRLTASINLTPKFFDDLLSVNANVKGGYVRNNYDQGSLGSAVAFNPTLPVKNPDGNAFNGWTTYMDGGRVAGPNDPGSKINTLMAINPVSMVDDYDCHSKVWQSVGNLQLDLKMPFLRELRVNLNLGYDYNHGECTTLNTAFSPLAWKNGFATHGNSPADVNGPQVNRKNGYTTYNKGIQERYTLLLDAYVNYNKEFPAIYSSFDVTAGYSWQRFNESSSGYDRVDPAIAKAKDEALHQWADYQFFTSPGGKSRYQLVSFFGRLNWVFFDKYLVTATVRRDGTSRFGKDHRWGTFPSVALGWKILEESFMEGARGWMDEFKLRAGYGVTGQQDLGSDYFPYLPVYNVTTGLNNRYPIDGEYLNYVYPEKYNADLKWEETKTWNVGVDLAFLNNRITAALDFYVRKTTDLLTYGNYPAGSNLNNMGNFNFGDLKNTGVEFTITARPVVTQDFKWTTVFNYAWNKNKITRLADGSDTTTGGIGNGVNTQKHAVGEKAFTFWVYQQVYDKAGNPLEGVYVDQNGDGEINDNDRIMYHSVNPDVTLSWNNTFNYKNWDLGISLRGCFGNWAYNKNQANAVFANTATSTVPLSNLMDNQFLFQQPRNTQSLLSSYWVQNASFIRCDNITLGYTWSNLCKDRLRLRVYGAVQNPFVITKYKGLDPELMYQGGIDNSPYPKPITVTLGLVANF